VLDERLLSDGLDAKAGRNLHRRDRLVRAE
jgi:hypothetical protein